METVCVTITEYVTHCSECPAYHEMKDMGSSIPDCSYLDGIDNLHGTDPYKEIAFNCPFRGRET